MLGHQLRGRRERSLLSEPNLTIVLALHWKQPLSSSDKELLTSLGKLAQRTVTYSSISC